MVSLDKKVSKQKNDDFAVKLEPLTYNEVIKSYGVELKFAKDLDKVKDFVKRRKCSTNKKFVLLLILLNFI